MSNPTPDSRLGIGKKIIFSALVVLISSALGLVATELFLRWDASEIKYLVWKPKIHMIFHPKSGVMPGIGPENRFSTNEWGIRGDDFSRSDDYRILALGGSTTECLYLDDSEAWPYVLQQRLNAEQSRKKVWVGNIGRSGQSTRDHILQMQLLVPLYPEIDTVLLLIGANDLLLRLLRDKEYRPLWLETPEYMEQLMPHAFPEFANPGKAAPLLQRTRIGRGVTRLMERLNRGPEQILVQGEDGASLAIFRQARRLSPKVNELPDLSLALEEYRRNVQTIFELGRKYRIRTIFVTQPSLWRPDLPLELDALLLMGRGSGGPLAGNYYTVEVLTAALAAYNMTLLSVCEELAIRCVDLASKLPQDGSVFYDDFHFNESGARQVGDVLARELVAWEPFRAQGLVPGAPRLDRGPPSDGPAARSQP